MPDRQGRWRGQMIGSQQGHVPLIQRDQADTGWPDKLDAIRVTLQSVTTCAAVRRLPSEAMKKPVPATADPGLWASGCGVSG